MKATQKIENYIEFVNLMWKKFKAMGEIISESGEVTPQKINTALAHYGTVSSGLRAEYRRQKIHHRELEIKYQLWEAEKMNEAKKKVIADYKEVKSIKPSMKEYENQLKLDNKNDWYEKQISLAESEERTKFLLDLRNDLDKTTDILRSLSTNMRSEMKYLTIDEDMGEEINPYIEEEMKKPSQREPISQ